VVVVRVRTGGAADEGGVKEGDLILEVNRKPVTSLKTYERLAAVSPKGRTVLLLMKRQGRTVFLTLRP
jgi:serine protease Do